jgi:hypothetical protein
MPNESIKFPKILAYNEKETNNLKVMSVNGDVNINYLNYDFLSDRNE